MKTLATILLLALPILLLSQDNVKINVDGVERWKFEKNRLSKLNASNSIHIGDGAGKDNLTTQFANVAIGDSTLSQATSGNNTAIGHYVMRDLTTGNSNVGIGAYTMSLMHEGERNIGLGNYALRRHFSGDENIAIGYRAIGSQLNAGSNNIALGTEALSQNKFGSSNIAIGSSANFNNSHDSYQIAIGQDALYRSGEGINTLTNTFNIAIGVHSLRNNIEGIHNVAFGFATGFNNLGSDNVFLGYQAGYLENGSNKLYIANTLTTLPLIYGDFSTKVLNVNGNLGVGVQNPAEELHIRSAGTSGSPEVLALPKTQ